MQKSEIIIIGAGAAGLMAAYELSKAGKQVLILEARSRIGGRIWPLSESEFGYSAQGGGEFTHGKAKVTKSLVKEAGLTYIPMSDSGERWSFHNGDLTHINNDPEEDSEFAKQYQELREKLSNLKNDVSIRDFLKQNFDNEKYRPLRARITRMVEGFDAADPNKISTFSVRDEWLGHDEWEQGRVKEGYKAILDFLESSCRKNNCEIYLNHEVKSVERNKEGIVVTTVDEKQFNAGKVVITVALPVIKQIEFTPPLPEKLKAASQIGFGQVIKILLRFKDRFWLNSGGRDLSKLVFLFSDQPVGTWWTQYPENYPVLTGWIAGPKALKFKDKSDEEIIDLAIESLANIFKVNKNELRQDLLVQQVANWPNDRLTLGAYSYSIVGSENAYAELRKPVENKIYFAGEAVYLEKETATVEGALASGQEIAKKILSE
jgi:monoamine oxidase